MADSTFSQWLKLELLSAQYTLLTKHESLDRLLFEEAPRLEQEYLEKIGQTETEVIRQEIECEVLKKKQQLVQAAINRRQPIDESQIDAEADAYREQLCREAETGSDGEVNGQTARFPGNTGELQQLYHEIVRIYHPQTNPELTTVQREVFEKAQWAYRQQNLDALKLCRDILKSADSAVCSDMDTISEIGTDYCLAEYLFPAFVRRGDEIIMQGEIRHCRKDTDGIGMMIDQVMKQFPLSAKQMLSDPEQIREYQAELETRMRSAHAEQKRYEAVIQNMIEGARKHG